MQTGITDFIYKNHLDKACFQRDMAYGKPKDLARRTESHILLRDKAFKIASNLKYDGYQRRLASMDCNFLIRNLVEVVLLPCQIMSLKMSFNGRLLGNLREKKFINLLETIFGVLI